MVEGQWLKDNGVVWCDGDDVTKIIHSDFDQEDGKFLVVYDGALDTCGPEYYFEEWSAKEIQLEIQPAKVVGYSLVEKVENKSEKELKLEELIGKLSSQLEEAQTELKSIK